MPAGFCYDLKRNDSFKDFIMHCAENFIDYSFMSQLFDIHKILQEIRLNPNKSRAYDNAIKSYEKDLEFLNACNNMKQFNSYCKKRETNYNLNLKKRYNAMLDKVKAWIPPTEDHIKLKNFMIDQIKYSIRYDCNITHRYDNTDIKREKLILEINIDHYKKEKERYNNEYIKTIEWIQQIKESIT